MLTKKHLKNALLDGEFILPFAWIFWDKILDENKTLTGESKRFGSDLICQPLELNKRKTSLLISLTDTKNKNWYSWVHSED